MSGITLSKVYEEFLGEQAAKALKEKQKAEIILEKFNLVVNSKGDDFALNVLSHIYNTFGFDSSFESKRVGRLIINLVQEINDELLDADDSEITDFLEARYLETMS